VELLLTDRLACPRCGPEFGLILRADQMADRRVREGVIGCPNCRDSFMVAEGFVDLRPPPRKNLAPALAVAGDPIEATSDRLMALLGLARGPGTVALVGAPALLAEALVSALEDVQVVAIDPATAEWSEVPGVTRMITGEPLPFFSRMLRGAIVDGRLGESVIAGAARVVGPGSRVVVVHAFPGAQSALEQGGCTVLAEEAGTIVAARS
jgi:uncharacterized protein YbaR (Trm112 family)